MSLVYKVSSRIARAIQRNNKKKKKQKNKTKKQTKKKKKKRERERDPYIRASQAGC